MNYDPDLPENKLSRTILDECFAIHKHFGPGMLEGVYSRILCSRLKKLGHKVEFEKAIPLFYDGELIDISFRADIIVDGLVLIELKSVEKLEQVHKKQVLTYLKLTGLKLGLLINFNEAYLREGIERIVNGL